MSSQRVRQVIFFAFLAVFFFSAPLIVLYTAGYRYNFENGSIVRTGTLSISSSPRGATIFLNDEEIDRKSPYLVKRLVPDTYNVRLEKDGYHAWEGSTDVKSQETSFLSGILLFQDTVPDLILHQEILTLAPSPGGTKALYLIRDGGWDEVWLLDTLEDRETMIGRFVSSDELPTLAWSARGNYVIRWDGSDLAIWDQDGVSVDFDQPFGVEHVFWHPGADHILYFVSFQGTWQLDLETGEWSTFTGEDVSTILLDASLIRFVTSGSYTELQQINNNTTDIIALLPYGSYEVIERDGAYLLVKNAHNELLLIDINADTPLLLQTYALSFNWLESEDRLVYSDGFEVNIYTPSLHTTEFITRQGTEIRSVAWHPSGATILFATDTSVAAIDAIKKGDTRHEVTLLSADDITSFWTSDDGRYLFLYGTIDLTKGLYAQLLTSAGFLGVF